MLFLTSTCNPAECPLLGRAHFYYLAGSRCCAKQVFQYRQVCYVGTLLLAAQQTRVPLVTRQVPSRSARCAQAALVVYDEIHYLRDKERGVVWEESIVLMPKTVRFAFLSATIPNALEFAQWIAKTHGCGAGPALRCAARLHAGCRVQGVGGRRVACIQPLGGFRGRPVSGAPRCRSAAALP